MSIYELHPKVQQDIEKIVERAEAGEQFRIEAEGNIVRLYRLLQDGKWSDYSGEETGVFLFGSNFSVEEFPLDPCPCCVCGSVIGQEQNEWGRGFWPKNPRHPFRVICLSCHRRWWTQHDDDGAA